MNARLTRPAAPAAAQLGPPSIPYGDTRAGNPHARDEHAGHDIANLTTRRADEGAIGRRVCLTCDLVLGPLTLCNQPTKRGRPCRVPVRTDLGHSVCWSHGEGRGRTNRRRGPKGEPKLLGLGGPGRRPTLPGLDDGDDALPW